MKKKLALILLVLSGAMGYSQSLDCSKFKNGKFYNKNKPNIYFVIKDTIMEDFMDDNLVWTWSIKWINDCQYEAVCTKSTMEFVVIGDKMIVTITDINDDCFTFNRKLLGKTLDDGSDTKSYYSCIKKD
nr:hypothetical protein [uncultured Flavobacterium sp.]